jgi:hemoglobin
MPSLYDHAGGDEGLHRLEDTFYSKVLADPLLQPLFGKGKPDHVEHLTWFTAESFGGPDRFTKELGFAHLIHVHRGLGITEEQRQRFVELYGAALDQAGLPSDPPFREAVMEHVEFGSQVAKENSNAASDAELHPLRQVPRWTWASDDSPTTPLCEKQAERPDQRTRWRAAFAAATLNMAGSNLWPTQAR